MKILRRILVAAASTAVGMAIGGPWALYAAGLANIVGRPEPPAPSSRLSPTDAAIVWCTLEGSEPVPESLRRLTPHGAIWDFVLEANDLAIGSHTGGALTSFVARRYNANHARERRSLWWHWSDGSMSIWLTRHWTLDELLAAAAAELRAYPPHPRRREALRARCGELSP
ncbi:MAG: hypothetical protein IPK07_16150 [Deltaproteobacteria bacterium]|nr:hypothetical protein [Deltaproteobacteria bacterium]